MLEGVTQEHILWEPDGRVLDFLIQVKDSVCFKRQRTYKESRIGRLADTA